MLANVARVQGERPRLAEALAAEGWRPQPSVTNFILLDLVTEERSEAAALALMRRGLVPRTFGHRHPLAHCLRVTVRDPGRERPAHRGRPGDRPHAPRHPRTGLADATETPA